VAMRKAARAPPGHRPHRQRHCCPAVMGPRPRRRPQRC